MAQPLNRSTAQPLNRSTAQPLNRSTAQPLNRSKPLVRQRPPHPPGGPIAIAFGAVALLLLAVQHPLLADNHTPRTGIYADVGAGVVLIHKQTDGISGSTKTERDSRVISTTDTKVVWEYSPGFSLHGAIGYGFGDVRVEADFSYLTAGAKAYQPRTPDAVIREIKETLRMNVIGLMANGWYRFQTGTGFIPFLGVGVGGASLSVPATNVPAGTETPTLAGWGLAYQASAGAGVEVAPGVELKLGYRFFGTTESKLEYKNEIATTTVTATASPTILSHRFELGASFHL